MKKEKMTIGKTFIYIFVISFALVCLYPFLLTVGGSLMTDREATLEGYKVIPKNITLDSYRLVWANKDMILNGYKVTIIVTILGTLGSVIVNGMMGYGLSRRQLPGRAVVNLYVLITMLFNGGMVSWYIVCSRYLHLKDTILALILPSLVNAWNIFLIRNYFFSMPEELCESARLDGASEFTIFFRIYLILAKPVIATVTLFAALGYWNDWWLGLMLVDNAQLHPLQMLLRSIMANIQYLQTMSQQSSEAQSMLANVPGNGVKMAMTVITTGPIILLYPFLQRYFMKGIMVGAVKG